jgi:cyclopropane fatty-acyl-phospholipid synthase-like methyltransferase
MSKEWFETFQDELWLKAASADRKAEAGFLYDICNLAEGRSFLDAPCGAGDVSVHLARKGVRITGLDLVADHIERARKLFFSQGLSGRFLRQDLREMDFHEEFDAAANWFGSFGYFSQDENQQLLLRYARGLKPGGRLVIDQVNREAILRNFRRCLQVGSVVVENTWKNNRVNGVWTRREGGKSIQCRSSIRLYTPAEMGRLARKAGLEVVDFYGDWQGSAYRRGSRRLVMLARKD